MSRNESKGEGNVSIWAMAAILVSLILILCRILPIGGPAIFSDEYAYAAWCSALFHGTQTPPPLAAALGNWLYLRLYEIAYVGVGSFLVKARVLNAITAAFAAGLLVSTFHTAEQSRKVELSALLAIGFVVSLLGTYAAYFIPEAPYFASVCLWLYCGVKYIRSQNLLLALAIGFAGGIATMTKAHGIFMLPSSFLVVLVLGLRTQLGWRKVLISIVLLVAGWFACTSAVDLLLGTGGGLDPLGGFYTSVGLQTAGHLGSYRGTLIAELALRHVATLILIVGMPLLLCAWLSLLAVFSALRSDAQALLRFPALLVFCTLAGMLVVACVFTISVADTGPFETLTRLHGRYYEHFALLASCIGIVGSKTVLSRWTWGVRLAVLLAFLVLLGLSWKLSNSVGWQNPNDFATAYALYALPNGRQYALVLGAVGATAALAWPRHAPAFLACAFLVWLGIDSVTTEKLRWPIHEHAAGRVAAMVAESAAGSTPASVEIVGSSDTVPFFRAAFHLLNDRIGFALGSAAKVCGVAGGTPDWVVTVEGAKDPCGYVSSIRIGDAAAARRVGVQAAVVQPAKNGQYRAKLLMIDRPEVTDDGRDILVTVDVTNEGSETFGSATSPHNVNLGAHSIDARGDVIDNDLARGHLPQIAPGTTGRATILLPADLTVGHRVELLPVQEGMAWFDKWGTESLIVGPFVACQANATDRICDAAGQPLKRAPRIDSAKLNSHLSHYP